MMWCVLWHARSNEERKCRNNYGSRFAQHRGGNQTIYSLRNILDTTKYIIPNFCVNWWSFHWGVRRARFNHYLSRVDMKVYTIPAFSNSSIMLAKVGSISGCAARLFFLMLHWKDACFTSLGGGLGTGGDGGGSWTTVNLNTLKF